jgi:hypothetical protein
MALGLYVLEGFGFFFVAGLFAAFVGHALNGTDRTKGVK